MTSHSNQNGAEQQSGALERRLGPLDATMIVVADVEFEPVGEN